MKGGPCEHGRLRVIAMERHEVRFETDGGVTRHSTSTVDSNLDEAKFSTLLGKRLLIGLISLYFPRH